jgi:hypothetical protein
MGPKGRPDTVCRPQEELQLQPSTNLPILSIELSHEHTLCSVPQQDVNCSGQVQVNFKLKLIYDRRSVGQSLLVSGSHLEPITRFLFSVWRLRVSWSGAPSLTRGWVCNLVVQLLLGLAWAVTLRSKSRATHGHILVSHLRLPQPGGIDPRIIYIPQEQDGPVIPPGHWVSFCVSISRKAQLIPRKKIINSYEAHIAKVCW